jgi:hypothetical protein
LQFLVPTNYLIEIANLVRPETLILLSLIPKVRSK